MNSMKTDKEIMQFRDFKGILDKLNLESKKEESKIRIGKIREILNEEFEKNYFNIQINNYLLKKEFKEIFNIEENIDFFGEAEYTKAVKIAEMFDYNEMLGVE